MRGLTTQNFLPAERGHIQFVPRQVHRECGRGGVADGQTFAVGGDRITIGNTHARGGAVPREYDVGVEIDLGEIDDLAVFGGFDVGLNLQLFDHIRDPARTKGFPSDHRGLACAKQRPHSHFNCAGVRRRHDTDFVICRNAQNLAGRFNGVFQLGLADGGTVRTAQSGIIQFVQGESGVLGTGARRKARISRARSRLFDSHVWYPSR